MELKVGDIILYRGQNIISEAVEHITNSQYSHSACYIGGGLLIEADGWINKVRYLNIDHYKGKIDIYRYKNGLNENQQNIIVDYLKNQIGSHYDYFLLFLEMFRYFFGLKFIWDTPKSFICSELVNDAYLETGINLCPGIKYPSPKDLSESHELIRIGSY